MFGEFRLPKATLQPLYRRVGDSYIEIPNRLAVVGENGKVYDIVSDRYQLILHEDVVSTVRKVLKDLKIDYEEKIRVSYDGSFMVARYITGDVGEFKVGFTVTNSYDRSSGINVTGYLFRLVCKNGLVVGEDLLSSKFRHYAFVVENDYNLIKTSIERLIDSLDEVLQLIEMSKKKTVSVLDVIHFVESTFKTHKKLRTKIYKILKKELGVDIDYWLVVYKGVKNTKNYEDIKNKSDKVNLFDSLNGITYVLSRYRLDERVRYELSKRTSYLLSLAR